MTLNDFLAKAGDLFKANASTSDAIPKADHEKALSDLAKAQADLTAVQEEVTNLKAQVTQKDSELSTATQSLAAATKERDEAKATISDPAGEIEKKAAAKAQTILASTGQAPLTAKPSIDPANPKTQTDVKGRDRFLSTLKVSN